VVAATTVSIDELQRDADRVGEASAEGPVFVTRPGRSTLAVIDIEAYRKLSGNEPTIVDLLANPEGYALSSTLLAWAQNPVALWIYSTSRRWDRGDPEHSGLLADWSGGVESVGVAILGNGLRQELQSSRGNELSFRGSDSL
jgi:hypothetical protein